MLKRWPLNHVGNKHLEVGIQYDLDDNSKIVLILTNTAADPITLKPTAWKKFLTAEQSIKEYLNRGIHRENLTRLDSLTTFEFTELYGGQRFVKFQQVYNKRLVLGAETVKTLFYIQRCVNAYITKLESVLRKIEPITVKFTKQIGELPPNMSRAQIVREIHESSTFNKNSFVEIEILLYCLDVILHSATKPIEEQEEENVPNDSNLDVENECDLYL